LDHRNKVKVRFIFFFLLCFFQISIFQFSQPSSSLIFFDLKDKTNNIAVTNYGISEIQLKSQTIKWKEAINKTLDDELVIDYFSGQRGMSSIGLAYLKLYNTTQNNTYLNIAEKIGNYIEIESISTDQGTVWPKSESNPWNWTGIRYGNAGIIPFLIQLSDLNNDSRFMDLASTAADYLVNIKKNNNLDHAWWLTAGDSGFVTTDYYYGTAGIVSSLLDVYESTGNDLYLDVAINGALWLDSLFNFTNTEKSMGFLRWAVTNDTYFSNLKYTGILSGQSGIGKVFLKLYQVTEDIKWFENAKIIGTWLKNQDINDTGLYPYPGSPYLTNRDDNAKNILGMSSGSIGIADFYLDLYSFDNDNLWLYEVIRILNTTIESLTLSDYGYILPYQLNQYIDDEYYIGNWNGMSGLIQFLSRLISLFNHPDHIKMLNNVFESLDTISHKFNGYIPPKLGEEFILTNGENGIAGIILGLNSINAINLTSLGKFNEKYVTALKTLPDPVITYISSEKTLNDQSMIGALSFLIIVILKLKIRNRKESKVK
jgi:lantibiotic modifying enzyme